MTQRSAMRKAEPIPLEAIRDADASAVGAKAANLARLIRAGLPIPPGFCVTCAAYREHVTSGELGAKVPGFARELRTAAAEGRRRLLSELREEIAGVPVSESLRTAIEKAWTAPPFACPAGGELAAVRSSATAEDLPRSSFAGQYDTRLGVAGPDECVAAIKACWASLWSDRAYEYREKNGIDHLAAGMAVIVQRLVHAGASGVLFTADPVSGARDRIVIESAFGLGEAVVGGRVSPDRVVVAKDELRVVESTVSRKTIEIVPAPGHRGAVGTTVLSARPGTVERPVEAERAQMPSVDEVTALRLAVLGARIEKEFGRPQDVEWAVCSGEVYVLQSRPITALPAPPKGGRKGANKGSPPTVRGPRDRSWEERQVWTNANAAEVLPDVMTPMTWSVIGPVVRQIIGAVFPAVVENHERYPLVGLIAGRAYANLNTFVGCLRRLPGMRKKKFSELFGGSAGAAALDEIVIPDEDIPDVGVGLGSLPGLLYGLLTHSPVAGRRYIRRMRSETDAMYAVDLRKSTDDELAGRCVAIVNDILGDRDPFVFAAVGMMYSTGLFNLCRRLFGQEGGEEGNAIAARLLSGLGAFQGAQAGLELWRLATFAHGHADIEEAARSSDGFAEFGEKTGGTPAGDEFLRLWEAFLRRHGHHTRGEAELMNARWSEQPDYVLGLLRGYLLDMGKSDPEAHYARLAAERRSLAVECRRKLRNPVKRLVFDYVLRQAQIGSPIRENSKNELVRRVALVRRMLLELGRSLVWRRVIASRDDIFFLTIEELVPALSDDPGFHVRDTVGRRREEYERNLRITPPPVVIGRPDPAGFAGEEVDVSAAAFFTGVPVSPGVVEGPARVILQSGSDTVRPGEILVAPSTDPGWAPYFLNAAGIVMGVGGVMSHGSIIAREYGIPCVVNVGPATKIVKTGRMLRVDGGRGEVAVLARGERSS